MKLLILIDDCPRTNRPLRGTYCREAMCLYFKGPIDKVNRECIHPKAESCPQWVALERRDIIVRILESRKKGGQ